ncbi:MAG: helix-turn-helix transcriptional regulator [Clostridia bacterium]|nr:helix-turn-helix transcriptional regulator [Clostridia bacterium]
MEYIKNEVRSRIANNISILVEHRGGKLKDLEKVLNVAYSTVAAFANGTRHVSDEHLEKIAKYYKIPFEILKEETLSFEYLREYDAIPNMDEMLKKYELFFQSKVTSQMSKDNKYFQKADELFDRIREFVCMETMPKTSRELYYKAYKEDGILAGAANTLMMLFIEYTQTSMERESMKKFVNSKLTNGDIYSEYKKINQPLSDARKKFINDTKMIFDECIGVLWSVDEGKYLAEYYLALKYLLCMVDNNRACIENIEIGSLMMLEFMKLGNSLAKGAVSVFELE